MENNRPALCHSKKFWYAARSCGRGGAAWGGFTRVLVTRYAIRKQTVKMTADYADYADKHLGFCNCGIFAMFAEALIKNGQDIFQARLLVAL